MDFDKRRAILGVTLGIFSGLFVVGNEIRGIEQRAYSSGITVDYKRTLEMRETLKEMKMHRDFVIPEETPYVGDIRLLPYYHERFDDVEVVT